MIPTMDNKPRRLPAAHLGRSMIKVVESITLFVIALATLYATGEEIWKMISTREVTLGDLLLLFIYLEVLTMVGVYLDSGALPVRIPLYIAIVALARHVMIDIKSISEWGLVAFGSTILLIALAVLVIRYGHLRFPYESPREIARDDVFSKR